MNTITLKNEVIKTLNHVVKPLYTVAIKFGNTSFMAIKQSIKCGLISLGMEKGLGLRQETGNHFDFVCNGESIMATHFFKIKK